MFRKFLYRIHYLFFIAEEQERKLTPTLKNRDEASRRISTSLRVRVLPNVNSNRMP